jgi:hypothetical protein
VRGKSTKIVLLSLAWVVGLVLVLGAVLYWRLTQGPVSLAFVGGRLENAINSQLPGLKISMGGAELELDTDTHTPHVRARNLVLKDATGTILASAPKAGVTIDKGLLLSGTIGITELELIGPRVNVRRNLDGSVALGIANEGDVSDAPVELDSEPESNAAPGKSDNADQPPSGNQSNPFASGSKLMEILDAGGAGGSLSRLEAVRITRGVLNFYDEANDATWNAPQADLAFRRVPSGFVIAAKAVVASTSDPWNIEAAATFRRDAKNYTASIDIDKLVPAKVAEKVFALSQFARVNIPFSGHLELEASEAGEISKATGQLFAAAGQVDLPDYLAKAIVVDEGTIRLSYDGPGQPLKILESSILMGGSRADMKGSVTPKQDAQGRLIALGFDLTADNVAVDTQGTVKDPVFIDRVAFSGSAAVEEQRVDIDDLVVMAGNTGVRLRGAITGGDESPGISIAGRLRDVSSSLLKKLWPPVIAPKSRTWINENVVSGKISEGSFQVNFAPNQLAQSRTVKRLPKGSVNLSFSMRDVETHYFKSLPNLKQASGSASLQDEAFNLRIDSGFAALPSGNRLNLQSGTFEARQLMDDEVFGVFAFDVKAPVPAMLEYAGLPDLNMADADIKKLPKLSGTAQAKIGLRFPMIKDVPRTRVTLTTAVSLVGASISDVVPGIDLTDGDFLVALDKDNVTVSGPAKVNGMASKIMWRQPRGGGQAVAELSTTLDAKSRAKLGLNLDAYMKGNVPVKVKIDSGDEGQQVISVDADLSSVDMRIAAAGWSRAAVPGTRAQFVLINKGKNGNLVQNLKVDGKGLHLAGSVAVTGSGGLQFVDLTNIQLAEGEPFAARFEPGKDAINLTISGQNFDARPYIKNIISPAKTDVDQSAAGGLSFIVNAKFKEVVAHRGETVRNLAATFVSRGGKINTANIVGTFESGLPVTLRVTPTEGGRELRVATADGGSALRASNFYSKIAGGEMEFYALMADAPGSPIRNGQLQLQRFEVRNEATLAELDNRGRPKKSGPRKGGIYFNRLVLPFTTDQRFVRICKVKLDGTEMGGVAQGVIRKQDGAIDITGTMIPAQGINGIFNKVPILGQILSGGRSEGMFGVTFFMGGTITKPKTQVNPLSLFAPGFLRKVFEFEGACGSARPANTAPAGSKSQ